MALKGVDVSVHQGAIDWKKVAKDGVKFAILRAGYGREISQKDKYFEVNYAGAKAAGIKVGAYWYSYADSVARGEQEARTFLKAIEGKKFDLPLFFDQEYETAILKLSDATRTDIVLRFVKTVKDAGYECGLYSSTDFLKNKLVTSRVADLKIWLAEYGPKLHYTGKVWAWQYSSKGRVSGIKGNVDMNHGYFEIAAPTKTQTQNSTGLLIDVYKRQVEVYDLERTCLDCGYRGEFDGNCPECNSSNLNEGYGQDTTIFVSTENLTDEVSYETDTGSVKNCFRLTAGDDLMTATVRLCNPSGGGYIWCITDDTKEDMSDELVAKINSYDELCHHYDEEAGSSIDATILVSYNELVDKYKSMNENLEKITSPIAGYSNLVKAYFSAIEFGSYLQTSMTVSYTHLVRDGVPLSVDPEG